jgi:hypothetical protein
MFYKVLPDEPERTGDKDSFHGLNTALKEKFLWPT